MQRSRVNTPLEIDDFVNGPPEVYPTPAVEFGVLSAIEADAVIRANKFQDEPTLFLADAKWCTAPPNKFFRKPVFQPFAGCTENFYVISRQADFFMKLTKHGFFGGLTDQHAALWKLPPTVADTAGKQQLAIVIRKNDANICPKAVWIDIVVAHMI